MIPNWQRVDQIINLMAEAAHQEIERMADEALIAVGFRPETVHRRRGQLRRHRKAKEQKA